MYLDNNVIKLMQDMEKVFIPCVEDAEKFAQGNNSAGTRVRKHMQQVKNLAQKIRVEVQEQKNSVTA